MARLTFEEWWEKDGSKYFDIKDACRNVWETLESDLAESRAQEWDKTPCCLYCQAKTKTMHVTAEGVICANCMAPRDDEAEARASTAAILEKLIQRWRRAIMPDVANGNASGLSVAAEELEALITAEQSAELADRIKEARREEAKWWLKFNQYVHMTDERRQEVVEHIAALQEAEEQHGIGSVVSNRYTAARTGTAS